MVVPMMRNWANQSLFLLPLILFAALAAGPTLHTLANNDFGFFYYASHIVLDGHGRLLYDFHEQSLYQAIYNRPHRWLFYYPPATLIPFLPFALLPFRAALLLWDLSSLLAITVCTAFLIRDRPPAVRFACALVMLLFTPMLYLMLEGQVSAVVFVAVTAAWLEWKGGKEFRGGLFLALGLLKFHLIAGFCAVLLLRRRGRALAGVAAGAAILYIAGAAIAGFGWPLREARLARLGEQLGAEVDKMPNLHGLMVCLTGHSHPELVLLLSAGVILFAAFFRGNGEQEFCAALLASLLVSWHMNAHDLTLAMIPLWLSHRLGWSTVQFAAAASALIFCSLALLAPYRYGFMGFVITLFLVAVTFPRRGRGKESQPAPAEFASAGATAV